MGQDVADVCHTRQIHHHALKAPTKASMMAGAVLAQVEIVLICLRIHAQFSNVRLKHVSSVRSWPSRLPIFVPAVSTLVSFGLVGSGTSKVAHQAVPLFGNSQNRSIRARNGSGCHRYGRFDSRIVLSSEQSSVRPCGGVGF